MGSSSLHIDDPYDIPDKSFDDLAGLKARGHDSIEESKEPLQSRFSGRMRSHSNYDSTFKPKQQRKNELVMMSQLRGPFNLSRSGMPSCDADDKDD